ncbi:hypothetical protein [Baekduia sp.]|uniref:hypothetical protein n=1 Tax=Baekduia sp. TaxID=2600305 RepID=UPI002D79E502|nr:hypothetical protein [Baekduia sp.]
MTEPDITPDVSPGHRDPDSEIVKDVELGVIVALELFHVAGIATFAAVMVHTVRPNAVIVITALPFVTSRAVVLVAVMFHALEELTSTALTPGTLVEQEENVGPAATPAAFVVWARSLPVDRTLE